MTAGLRLAVLADVHANLTALEAVLAGLPAGGVDGIIVAGDLVMGGPQPAETLQRLRDLGCTLIRGNGEDYIAALAGGSASYAMRTAGQWALARWCTDRLDPEALRCIASLPAERVLSLPGAAAIRIVHAAPGGATRGLAPDRDPAVLARFRAARLLEDAASAGPLHRRLDGLAEPVLVCGHTHIAWQQVEDGRLVLNPGAVSGSLEGDPRARYALLAWDGAAWRPEFRRVSYDLEPVRQAFRTSGLLTEGGPLARAFLHNIETGLNTGFFFVRYAQSLAAAAGRAAGGVVPDDIWDRAAATFNWGAPACPD